MTSTDPHSNEHQQTLNADIDGEFPEGGWRAWSVVLGAWCAMIPSMGMLNTIGVLDAWIGENQLAALPKSQTAWVVSLYAFFLYIGGSCAGECRFGLCERERDVPECHLKMILLGAIFDRYGLRPVIIPGSIGMVASLMCLSVSTRMSKPRSSSCKFPQS